MKKLTRSQFNSVAGQIGFINFDLCGGGIVAADSTAIRFLHKIGCLMDNPGKYYGALTDVGVDALRALKGKY